jgi:hypothetical protein
MNLTSVLRSTVVILLLGALAVATPARGEIIAAWDFEGMGPGTNEPPLYPWATTNGTVGGYNDSNLDTVVLTAHNLTPGDQPSDFYRFSGWGNMNTAPADIPSSHPNYIEFTLAAHPTYQFSLNASTSIHGSVRDYQNGPNILVLRSSLDSFTGNVAMRAGSWQSGTWILDVGSGFNYLTGVTFRLYVCNTNDISNSSVALRPDESVATGALANVDLVINGSVVPEPATALVAVLALLALVRRK